MTITAPTNRRQAIAITKIVVLAASVATEVIAMAAAVVLLALPPSRTASVKDTMSSAD